MTSTVTVRGPLWDGEAGTAVGAWLRDTEMEMAQQARAIVRSKALRMNRSGRGGTGIAATHVAIVPGADITVRGINDKGQVWWPWLEGTSRRNSTTRFKGYHAFRLAKNIVAKRARKIAQDRLDEYIGRMGGR